MILLGIITSLLLTVINIYLIIKIWQLKRKMTKVADDLVDYESSTKFLLTNATQIFNRQQVNIEHVRQKYELLQLRWQKIRQIITLLSWLSRIRSQNFKL